METGAHEFHTTPIPDEIMRKWQEITDLLTEVIGVPVALIMRKIERDITVFVSSGSKGNPYRPGDREILENSGLYCEMVIKNAEPLLVPNALSDPQWKSNPDIKHGLISYLGYPLLYPDGSPFGTICVLDSKENAYSKTAKRIIAAFRDIVQHHIALMAMNHLLGEQKNNLQHYIDEIKTLRGLLPICAYCKKIRDDTGYWESIETYISEHSNAAFSHGICPDCMARLYPKE